MFIENTRAAVCGRGPNPHTSGRTRLTAEIAMFVFGHIGFGRTMIGSKGRALPAFPLVVGMLLPDIIDKSLYYSQVSTFITCTRTFGHTALFFGTLFGIGVLTRSRGWLALAIGT